jgi:hypothetical protein
VAALSALSGREKAYYMELFDNVQRRDDTRTPASAVRHKRLLVESVIVEHDGIRAVKTPPVMVAEASSTPT